MSVSSYKLEEEVAELKVESPAKAAPPTFREASFDDYEQIATLEARNSLRPKSREEWKHLWLQNPSYYDFHHWPIGWVCEAESGEIVGSVGNVPLSYEFRKRRLAAATSRALVLEARYRPYAFTLLKSFFGQNNVDLFLNTSVNDRVFRLQELFHASRVPAGNWERSAFWITNYPGFTASALARKAISVNALVSYPVSAGLFMRDKLTGKDVRVERGEIATEFCSQFDERFESCWQRMRDRSTDRLMADRSPEVLAWHFHYALKNEQAWVITASDGSGLAAFGIFSREDKPALGLKRMRFVDFQGADPELMRPILLAALERCQHESIHMLEAFGFAPEKQGIIDNLNPHYRELSSWRYFYKAREPHLSASLEDPKVWDPTCFDGDSSL